MRRCFCCNKEYVEKAVRLEKDVVLALEPRILQIIVDAIPFYEFIVGDKKIFICRECLVKLLEQVQQ